MNEQLKKRGWRWTGWTAAAMLAGWLLWQPLPDDAKAEINAASKSFDKERVDGQELFHRSWLPEDPRSPEGDGLGPMFNESSCAGCHNQGGPGGAGPNSKNVELLTAFVAQPHNRFGGPNTVPTFPNPQPTGLNQPQPPMNPQVGRKAIVEELTKIHPEFAKNSSVVIHRFGTSPKHNQWRTNLLTPQLPPPNQSAQVPVFANGTQLALASFQPGSPFAEPAAEEPAPRPVPSKPPRSESLADFASPAQPTAPIAPGSQPAPLPAQVPVTIDVPFQQVQQTATFTPQNSVGNTGIPLVDEALQEMRRLQQEARQDLSGSSNRGRVILLRSQRNTSALFGAGVIDAIPDEVIEAAAKMKHEDFPRVSGRVHRLPDNRIGKFGWKAQKSTLRDFTLAACANELGLDVPGHAQPAVPYEAHEKPKGHDMTGKEADALVAFVRSLPAPIEETPADKQVAKLIE
jgi:mono/diheme cytochrome c family protein